MDRHMAVVAEDALDVDLQAGIGVKDRAQMLQRLGAAVLRHRVVLRIVLGDIGHERLVPLLLDEEELAELADDFDGGHAAFGFCGPGRCGRQGQRRQCDLECLHDPVSLPSCKLAP